jgi:hypothetical protein
MMRARKELEDRGEKMRNRSKRRGEIKRAVRH